MFDAAMISPPDGGVRDLGRDGGPGLPPAVMSPQGVLTPYPGLRFDVIPTGLRVVTANFTQVDDGDSRGPLLQGYIELRNVGSTMVCTGAPSVELDFVELIGTVYGDPYYERSGAGTVGIVANDCIVPDGVGVLDVVTRSMTLDVLASAVSMSIDIFVYNSTYSVFLPADGDVTMTREVVAVADGFAIGGTVTPRRDIYNFALRVYPRDARGLLYQQLAAFPRDLETLPAYLPQPYETEATSAPFSTYLSFPSWITR